MLRTIRTTHQGSDLGFLRNTPLEATVHEVEEKMPVLGASHLVTELRAMRPFVRTSHAPLRPDPVFRESEAAAHPAAAQK
jgi:hypothetical protein